MQTLINGLFLCFFFSQVCLAQHIEGKITDEEGQPLSGVNIYLVETKQATVTDSIGQYKLSNITPGAYTLRATTMGYQVFSKSLTIASAPIPLDIQLQASALLLESITIESFKADWNAPIAQTNLDKETIESVFIGQDAQFTLSQLSPSMISYSESGTNFSNYGGITLRGIDQSRINITLNGAPLNDMLDQGVFFSNFTDFMNSVASVQIQRGVGTSTNGTSSFAGSIHFESINLAESKPSVEIQTNAGSFDTYRGSIALNSGLLENDFAFYGRLTNFTTKGYREHSGTQAWSGFVSGGYFGEKDLVKFTAFNGRTRSELAYLAVPKPLIDQNPRTNLNFEQDQDNFGQQFAQLQYTRLFNEMVNLTSSLYYGSAQGDFPFGFEGDAGFQQINFPLENRHWGAMTNLNIAQARWSFNGGVHAYTFLRRNWETLLPDNVTTLYDDRSQKDELSAFAKFDYQLNRFTLYTDIQLRTLRINFTPDERFVPANTTIPTYRWTFLNPRVGFSYQINNAYSAYASFGRTGREPTKTDIFGGGLRITSENLAFIQNTDLFEPEYVNDFEGGIRVNKRTLSLQANLFYMQFENEIAAIGELDPFSFFQIRKNIQSSYRRGIELSWQWQPNRFFWRGNATWLQANIATYDPENDASTEVFTDVAPILTPNWLLQSTVGYNYKNRWEASLHAQYIDEMYLELTNQSDLTIPSSFVTNLQLGWRFHKQHSLNFWVYNLLDEQYFTNGQAVIFEGETVPAYFAQATRNFMVMLHLKF
ncbi:MAG: TonB-dependent receptor [Thermonemataceae bacterium]